jgi:hypothetical protein
LNKKHEIIHLPFIFYAFFWQFLKGVIKMRNNIVKNKRHINLNVSFLTSLLFLFALIIVYGCGGGGGDSVNPIRGSGDNGELSVTVEELAFQHLEEVMDKFHESFDVYSDLSAAGNHFVTLGGVGDVHSFIS